MVFWTQPTDENRAIRYERSNFAERPAAAAWRDVMVGFRRQTRQVYIHLTCFALHSLNFRLLLLRLLARRDRDRRAAPALHSGEHEIGIVGDVAEDVT